MQPFDGERESEEDRAGPKRGRGVTILAVFAVLAFIVLVVALHLSGGMPTHGR